VAEENYPKEEFPLKEISKNSSPRKFPLKPKQAKKPVLPQTEVWFAS
jgi:hypothetical protein